MASESIEIFFKNVVSDLGSQNTKVPVSSFRTEITSVGGKLYSPDWVQYMIYGRGPGKRPPFKEPNNVIQKWLQRNPSILTEAKTRFKYISEKGLAYLIGKSIGEKGTRIWRGEAKGVDLLGAIEKNLPDLLKGLASQEKLKFNEGLNKAIK